MDVGHLYGSCYHLRGGIPMNQSDGWQRVRHLPDDGDEDQLVHAECDEDDCGGGLWVKRGEKVCDSCHLTGDEPTSGHETPRVWRKTIGPQKDEERDTYYHSKIVILPGAGNGTDFWGELQ